MRPAPVAVLAFLAAVVGAVAAVGLGKAAGWLSFEQKTSTVVVQAPAAAAQPVARLPANAKPLAGNGFDPARIYARRAPGVVTIFSIFGKDDSLTGQTAQGSGFVVSPKGYILTNSHVITNAGESGGSNAIPARRVYVEFQDHDRVPAKVVGWDIFDDVGVIKVDPAAHRLVPLPLGDSRRVVVGEAVAAIGSPFGNENSLTVGVVSATKRSIESLTSQYNIVDAIQIDAPINHGNSGGPLFDARGRVIGINAQIRSDSGEAEGVGFAVPIDLAKRSMAQLIAAGRVSYAYVGIETEDLTPSVARRFHYGVRQGAVITQVKPHTPAAAAGLRGGSDDANVFGMKFTRGGDVIVAIAGRSVTSSEDVVRIVSEHLSPGETVRFTIVRDGRRRHVSVRLAERPTTAE